MVIVTRSETRRRATLFRFLDLPPELRNSVYKLLLGRFLIHLAFGKPAHCYKRHEYMYRRLKCACCRTFGANFEVDSSEADDKSNDWFAPRDILCGTGLANRLKLDLLLVCKQIRGEAGPLVFQENTFAFSEPVDVFCWMRRLSGYQVKAMKNICIYQTSSTRQWRCRVDRELAAPFVGLRNVSVFIELFHMDNRRNDLSDPGSQDGVLKGLEIFQLPHLQRVEVKVVRRASCMQGATCVRGAPCEGLNGITSAKEAELWAERTRRMLLART